MNSADQTLHLSQAELEKILAQVRDKPLSKERQAAVLHYRDTVIRTPFAPDGLPWPPGYFDFPPRQTFEKALHLYGVRPNHYYQGWPIYSKAETTRPEYKGRVPEESPELEAKWALLCGAVGTAQP